jgi:transposase
VCQRAPKNEADLPDWLADHIDDPPLLSVVAQGGWRYAATFYRGLFIKASQREANLKEEVARLNGDLRNLRHQLYGRKSESKNPSEQASTDTEGKGQSSQDTHADGPQPKRKRGAQPGHRGHPRKKRPHLPRVDQSLALSEQRKCCAQCGKPYEKFPPRPSSRIEYEVRIYEVHFEHERASRGCQCSQAPGIVEATAPPMVIPKSRFGTSVWLEVLLDKFHLHHPSNHFARDWVLREEGGMSTGVLNGGLRRLQPLFEPVYDLIVERNQVAGFWHADETGWPVFGEPRQIHGRKRWQLRVFRARDAVIYLIRPSRATEVPMEHFPPNVVGVLLVDRYAAYKKLSNEYEGIILAFCWAHVRRDFLEAARKHNRELEPWAMSWVEEIGELYRCCKSRKKRLEESAGEHPELCLEAKVEVVASEEQQALLEQVEKMHNRWEKELAELENEPTSSESKPGTSPKAKRERYRELAHREEKGKVLRSLRAHWCGLTLFLNYPDIPLDNNPGERSLRGGAVARKNYYGSGAQWSVQLTESLFSLFATLEICGINVRTWMSHYLGRCASLGGKAPDKEEIKEWLPWNMREEKRQEMSRPVAMPPPQPEAAAIEMKKAVNGADAISANAS